MRMRTSIVTITVCISLFILFPLLAISVPLPDIENNALNIARDSETSLAATPHALNPFLTFKDNVPYVTWTEIDSKGISLVYVKHKEGDRWVPDGGPLNQSLTGHANSPSLAFFEGNLYAAWSEVDAKHVSQVYVKQWDGERWVQRGGSLNINMENQVSSPVLSENNTTLYIVWAEVNPEGISLIHVKQWDGHSWSPLGDSINKDKKRHALTPSLVTGGDGLYLAWAEYDSQSTARVYISHWNGDRWEPLGEAINIDPERHALSPSLSLGGPTPHITWMEYNPDGISQIYVKRWDGRGWVQMGEGLNIDSSRPASTPSLSIKGNVPYVAWAEIDDNGVPNLYLKQWKRSSWIQTDRSLNVDTGRAAAAPAIAIKDNDIYLAFTEVDARGIYQLYVKGLNEADISRAAQGKGENTPNPSPSPQVGEKKAGRTFFTSMPKDPNARELPPPLAFKALPRTPMGEVNWMEGIRGGILKPFDSIDPEARPPSPINLDILLPVKKGFGIPDVIFPHSSHSMWLDCRNCHPTIFVPKRGGNPVTMHRILEGEYCARCHGVVAFRTYDCFRCHSGAR